MGVDDGCRTEDDAGAFTPDTITPTTITMKIGGRSPILRMPLASTARANALPRDYHGSSQTPEKHGKSVISLEQSPPINIIGDSWCF